MFRGYHQQDSHELLRFLITNIEEEEKKRLNNHLKGIFIYYLIKKK